MGADGDVRMPGGRRVVFDNDGGVSDDAWGAGGREEAANTVAQLFCLSIDSLLSSSRGGRAGVVMRDAVGGRRVLAP